MRRNYGIGWSAYHFRGSYGEAGLQHADLLFVMMLLVYSLMLVTDPSADRHVHFYPQGWNVGQGSKLVSLNREPATFENTQEW